MKKSHKFPPLGLTYFWCLNDYCDDAEIDFYARHPISKKQLLIQSSYQIGNEKTFQRECRSLLETGDYMKVDERLIVTWEDERELSNGIKIVPAWKFLLSQEPAERK